MTENGNDMKSKRRHLVDLVRGKVDKDLAFALCIGCESCGIVDEAIEYLEGHPNFTEDDFVKFVYEYVPEEDRLDQE